MRKPPFDLSGRGGSGPGGCWGLPGASRPSRTTHPFPLAPRPLALRGGTCSRRPDSRVVSKDQPDPLPWLLISSTCYNVDQTLIRRPHFIKHWLVNFVSFEMFWDPEFWTNLGIWEKYTSTKDFIWETLTWTFFLQDQHQRQISLLKYHLFIQRCKNKEQSAKIKITIFCHV